MTIFSEQLQHGVSNADLPGQQRWRSVAKPVWWAVVLGISVGIHGTCLSALAQPLEIVQTLSPGPNQSFETLMQQAEALANQSIRQAFAGAGADITTVSVQIVGERDGLASPLLFVTVTRTEWQKHPNLRTWARYFNGSKRLLGFVRPEPVPLVAKIVPDTVNSDNEPNFYR